VLYPGSLRGYLPGMQESARRLCALLASDAGQEVDIWAELSRMTLDVVGGAAFGWVACAGTWMGAACAACLADPMHA
jgi:hypothetical protein